jgi:hypothetical protein
LQLNGDGYEFHDCIYKSVLSQEKITMTLSTEKEGKLSYGLSSSTLHIIAMISMLIDHTLKTLIESDSWVIALGRLAFPIFAFMAAEGYFHTRNYGKYILRMFLFAVISEVPYDLMKSSKLYDWADQNVLWTFLLALLCIRAIDCVKSKAKKWVYVLVSIVVSFVGMMLGMVFNVDYNGMGVLMVLIFYLFHERKWWCKLLQFVLLLFINVLILGAFGPGLMVSVFGQNLEIPLQGFAILSLIPIWLYHGRQGYHSKPFQYVCYAFYPVHMLILYAVANLL